MNWNPGTLWQGDNLDILRGMDSDSVDLIYLDPPFNTGQTWQAGDWIDDAEDLKFADKWHEVDSDIYADIKDSYPALYNYLESVKAIQGGGMQAYLTFMAVRLIELRRVLKQTGSIYLHCDDNAVHCLRILMDGVFGSKRFRNMITWRRSTGMQCMIARYVKASDYLLFYTKSNKYNFNVVYWKRTKEESDKHFNKIDSNGKRYHEMVLIQRAKYQSVNRDKERFQPWKGYDPAQRGLAWTPPRDGKSAKYIEDKYIPGYRDIESVHARLDALYDAGLLIAPPKGKDTWRYKGYEEALPGIAATDILYQLKGFTKYGEDTEYPTQKPLGLLRLIIEASSNPGDIVLDPFCGSGTTCVAAEQLQRRWTGIDQSNKAIEVASKRLRESGGSLFAPDIEVRTDTPPMIHPRG